MGPDFAPLDITWSSSTPPGTNVTYNIKFEATGNLASADIHYTVVEFTNCGFFGCADTVELIHSSNLNMHIFRTQALPWTNSITFESYASGQITFYAENYSAPSNSTLTANIYRDGQLWATKSATNKVRVLISKYF